MQPDSDQTYHQVDYVSLCFKNAELEKKYHVYHFEISRNNLEIVFSTTAKSVCGLVIPFYLREIKTFLVAGSPGSMERILILIPITIFSILYLMQRRRKDFKDTEETSRTFVLRFVLLYTLAESSLMYVNDVFPEYEGCAANRFRCPFSFSSPKFATRAVLIALLVIFHLSSCISFLEAVQLSTFSFLFGRVLAFLFFPGSFIISVWSLCCSMMQIIIFLGCRYMQELQNRRKFLLQLHISQLRVNLQDLLDSMMPRSIAQRVQAGETVIDACPHVSVLFCAFPTEPSPQLDAMKAFNLLDQVHQAFDELLKERCPRAFKLHFAGNDFMLASPAFLRPPGPDAAEEAGADRALCATLARLAADMRTEAQHVLAGSGLHVRFGLAAAPACAAVIGATRRHLRLTGAAPELARTLSDAAAPWEVLCTAAAADAVLAADGGAALRRTSVSVVGAEEIFAIGEFEDANPAAAAVAWSPSRTASGSSQRSFKNLLELCPDAGGDGPDESVAEAVRELKEAVGRLGSGAALADEEEERQFLLETGEGSVSGGGGGGGGVGDAVRTAGVALCQGVFLAGLPGYDGGAGAAWGGGLRAWIAGASLCAGVGAGLVVPGAVGQAGRWGLMHAALFGGCGALAHARAEPFLLAGFGMGVSLCFVAPPVGSEAAARYMLWAAYAAFLAVFVRSGDREGLEPPSVIAAVPVAMMVHSLAVFLRQVMGWEPPQSS
jgi:class 3 adenylate cyclase